MMTVATTATRSGQARRLDDQQGAARRARCTPCLQSIRRLGEIVSTACRWLWATIRALDALDDDLERQEIDEVEQAQASFVEAVQLSIRDGRITPAERVALQGRALRMQRELQDVRRYNDEIEDPQHQEARKSARYARETLAPASRALDHAEALAGPRNGGCEAPWADVTTG